ncbi:MAG: TonB family protein [Acidobacteria bacterium]|nr:TonB family protein [Acidobacteriota bacterium]
MKLSTFMLAFLVSTAIHVGALTSNLLNVKADSILDNRARPVKLHIVPSAIRKPSAPPPEPIEEKIEKSRAIDSEIHSMNKAKPLEALQQDMRAVNTSEIALSEKHPVAEKPSPVKLPVYREKLSVPDNAMSLPEKTPDPPPTVTIHSIEQFQDAWVETSRPVLPAVSGPGNDACEDCSASLVAAASLVPSRGETDGSETGPATTAIITLSSKPTYPRYSRLHKEEGITVLSVEILPDGKLGNVEIVHSSGYRRLDEAAVKGMRKAELVPAVKDGRKIASVKRISIRFDLEDWGE